MPRLSILASHFTAIWALLQPILWILEFTRPYNEIYIWFPGLNRLPAELTDWPLIHVIIVYRIYLPGSQHAKPAAVVWTNYAIHHLSFSKFHFFLRTNPYNISHSYPKRVSECIHWNEKDHFINEFVVTSSTGGFNFQCSRWQQIHQYDDLSVLAF